MGCNPHLAQREDSTFGLPRSSTRAGSPNRDRSINNGQRSTSRKSIFERSQGGCKQKYLNLNDIKNSTYANLRNIDTAPPQTSGIQTYRDTSAKRNNGVMGGNPDSHFSRRNNYAMSNQGGYGAKAFLNNSNKKDKNGPSVAHLQLQASNAEPSILQKLTSPTSKFDSRSHVNSQKFQTRSSCVQGGDIGGVSGSKEQS